MGVFYISRERFAAAVLANPPTDLTQNSTIDRLLESKSRAVEEDFNRHFYPITQTRYYDWPAQFGLSPTRLYLNADLLSVSAITVGGTALTPLTSYFLEPVNYATDGRTTSSYSRIEIDLSGTGSFVAGATTQRAIKIAGDWGYSNTFVPAGTLAVAIASSSAVSCQVSDSSKVGVGNLLLIDTERILVTEKTLVTTTATLTAGIAADNAVVTVPLSSGTLVNQGEVITIDAERMYVDAVTGNNALVRRAVQGSVLAAHLINAVVYAPRTCTIERGYAGSTAATHLINATITKNQPPQLIADLVIAEAVSTFHQEKAGYARTIGSGDTEMQVSGRPLADIRRAAESYKRQRGPVAI